MHFYSKNNMMSDLSQLPKGVAAMIQKNNASSHDATSFSRRNFLKMSAASGFALGMFPAIAQTDKPAAGLKTFQKPAAFVQIAKDGKITVTINRLEFGQGVHTALPMILAEELDADWSKVGAVHGTADPAYADPVFGMHLTGGSGSIKHSYTQYRELGARARAMLITAAAAEWKVNPDTLRTDRSMVIRADGKTLSYGDLAEAAMKLAVPEKVSLKDPKTFKIIGKQVGRLDASDKSNGKQNFGIDVRLPGMLTALIAHPPVFGAKLKSVDDSAAKQIKGVRAILKIAVDRGGEGVAVIADGFWQAKQAREALKLDWDTSGVEKVDSATQLKQYQELAKTPGKFHFKADVSKLASAPKKITAEFSFPYLAHAAMEPLNCTVHLSADGSKAELWVGTQMPGVESMAAAQALGVAPQNINLHVQMAGGGFGRRAVPTCDYVVESCNVAKAARSAGIQAPIRTIWSREDDIKGGYYRPMHVHRAEIGYDEQGQVQAWDHVIVGQSIVAGTPFEGFLIKDGIDGTAVEGMRDPYQIPMRLSVHHPKVNVPVLWWRSVGSTHTAYVMETLIDEIARNAKQDPVAYRLKQFGDKHPRHTAALKLAVEKSGYNKRRLPKGQAWGVAVHESFETVVAYVVTASIKDGQAKLHTATAGVHCNLAVNPKTIEAQVQGGALMGLGMCLQNAAITFKEGVVEQSNFGDYAVARISDMPQMTVHIVPSADPPTGMGEPGLPPLAPAFANAIAKLTGAAPRSLPFNLKV
nr:xanthine dehydrogenase family protein molybdopterin-binding subunit [uncultured Undibacterium sp.]